MNKISKICIILVLFMMVFSIGYKIGDARGYDAGYTEGYRYDCREEIGNLYEQVKATKKAVEFTDKQLKTLSRENDSLKRPGVYDSARAIYSRDSVKYASVSRKKNDSLKKALKLPYNNLIQDNGRANLALCMLDSRLKNLPECKDGWRVDK